MKAIEEVAKEYGKFIWSPIEGENSLGILKSMSDFRAGVEFAQRWIPIEEELPPLVETVNAVFDIGNCGNEVVVSVWRGMGTDGKNKYYITLSNVVLLEEPIKWRPINRK